MTPCLPCLAENHVRYPQHDFGEKDQHHHFQENRGEEGEAGYGVFFGRAVYYAADSVEGRADGRGHNTQGTDCRHQNAEVDGVNTHGLHHRQEDGGQQQEVDVAVHKHT